MHVKRRGLKMDQTEDEDDERTSKARREKQI